MKLVGHPLTWLFDRYTDQFEISRFLAKAKVDFSDSSPVVSLEKGETLLSFLKRDDWGRVS